MIQFKKDFENHDIEIIVDNATTHSSLNYDLNLLHKFPGTTCPYTDLVWEENDTTFRVPLFNENKESIGLFELAKHLKLIDQHLQTKDISLQELRKKLSFHPAFQSITKLEMLAKRYKNIAIIWCPKYHCELNPIEGVWCYSKNFVRKQNDQNFSLFGQLIVDSFKQYKESTIHVKLWNRFWETIALYKSGGTYKDVLQTFFGAKTSDKVKSHRKNQHFNSLLKKP